MTATEQDNPKRAKRANAAAPLVVFAASGLLISGLLTAAVAFAVAGSRGGLAAGVGTLAGLVILAATRLFEAALLRPLSIELSAMHRLLHGMLLRGMGAVFALVVAVNGCGVDASLAVSVATPVYLGLIAGEAWGLIASLATTNTVCVPTSAKEAT